MFLGYFAGGPSFLYLVEDILKKFKLWATKKDHPNEDKLSKPPLLLPQQPFT